MKKTRHYACIVLALGLCTATMAQAGWEEGVAAFRSGNLNQAANEFKAIVDSQPDWPGGHYMLGWTHLRMKRPQEAITYLRKAYDLQPGNAEYQLRLGEAYVNARRYADAVGMLSKINTSGLPGQAQGHLSQLLAVAYSRSGQGGRALAEFGKAARAQPNNADLWYQYGVTAFNEGDNDQAIQALTKAAQLDSRDADKQKSLAQALLKKGRTTRTNSIKSDAYRKASAAAQKVVAANSSADNLIFLGECQLGAKQYDAAIASFQQATAKASSNWLPHYYIGQAYTAKAQYRSAESSLKQALDNTTSAQNQTRVWRQLAFVFEKQQNYNSAIDAYRRAGDNASATRVQENRDIKQFNRDVEAENQRIQQLEEEKKALEEELKSLPGGPPPSF